MCLQSPIRSLLFSVDVPIASEMWRLLQWGSFIQISSSRWFALAFSQLGTRAALFGLLGESSQSLGSHKKKFDKNFPQQKSNFKEFCVTDLIILNAPYWNVCLSRKRKGSFLPSMELNEKRLGLFPLSILTLLKDFSWIENQVRSVCDFRRLNNEANISNAVFLKIDTKPHYFLLSKLSDPDVISFFFCL